MTAGSSRTAPPPNSSSAAAITATCTRPGSTRSPDRRHWPWFLHIGRGFLHFLHGSTPLVLEPRPISRGAAPDRQKIARDGQAGHQQVPPDADASPVGGYPEPDKPRGNLAGGLREPHRPTLGRIGTISGIRRYAAGALVAGCALIAAACSSSHKPAHVAAGPTTTTAPATTTTGSTAATAPPGAPLCPLTGLPAVTPANVKRPALSVKVDNAPSALPQIGLNNADIVTEEVVEGGLTRFFVTFQCQDAAVVGPIRSARPVDADLLRELNGGILVYSGAAIGEIAPSKAHSNAVLISMDAGNHGFYRDYHRIAPSNVFGSTAGFYQEAYRVAGPHIAGAPQLFQYSATPPSGFPTSIVSFVFSNYDAIQ